MSKMEACAQHRGNALPFLDKGVGVSWFHPVPFLTSDIWSNRFGLGISGVSCGIKKSCLLSHLNDNDIDLEGGLQSRESYPQHNVEHRVELDIGHGPY